MSRPIDRRAFVQRATSAGAAVSLSLAGPLTRNVLGANDRVRVGAIGTGRQALSNMKAFQKHGAEVVAICDVYEPNLAKGKAQAGERGRAQGLPARARRQDDRHGDRRHPRPLACASHGDGMRGRQGRVRREAGRSGGRGGQGDARRGAQAPARRAGGPLAALERPLPAGGAGRALGTARQGDVRARLELQQQLSRGDRQRPGLRRAGRARLGLWLGPAPKVPFNANRFGVRDDRWSTFRYFWDYSNGILGDWGVHHLDIVQWAMGTPGPRTITCVGQKLALQDNGDAPDTQTATFEYPDFVCSYEYRAANANSMFGKGYGLLFHGSEATMLVNRQGFEVFPETRKGKDDKDVARSAAMKMDEVDNGLENHAANMLECMRTRKRPACDIEEGLRSSAPCLLGVVALRTGERLEYDASKLELQNASAASKKLFGREYRAPWKLA